ncbi:MAG: isochorismatase family protein [Phycisphaerae bacterium]|nr:isochorismatase family protein [Phycisphaerae bacterium]
MQEYKTHKSLAKPRDCVLLVIDVQDRLVGTISQADIVITNITALVKAAQIHQIPILMTEQEKLGSTVPPLKGLLDQYEPLDPITKQSFSSCRNAAFGQALERLRRKYLLIAGIETHICISQTALDLLANDYLVYVVADATSSHTTQDHKTAIERLSKQGATITTTEALIFELTATAQAPAFKQVLDVVKDRRNALSKQ